MLTDKKFTIHQVLNDVIQERAKQDAKWGEQDHSFDRWMIIEGEELGEAIKAVTDEERYAELIQCISVLVNAAENYRRNGAKWRPCEYEPVKAALARTDIVNMYCQLELACRSYMRANMEGQS